MIDSIDIAEVVRRTGLSSRALRFYEARGLIEPLRTASGRRIYGPSELSRLHQITVLKAAGLSLSQMAQLFSGKMIELGSLLRAQIKMLEENQAQIERALHAVNFVLSRIDQGEPVDAATLCSLIETGDRMMKQEPRQWQELNERYFSTEERSRWAESFAKLGEFDHDSYARKWSDLGGGIKAALPLDPASETAAGFVDEWYALLKPFADVASPEMWNGTVAMYDDMDNWPKENGERLDPGFDKQVWDFMKLATAARLAQGAKLSPLAPNVWGNREFRGGNGQ